ncbi:hypothetical protein [Nostoc sp.]|uniref:hypothetical protein n=1 Tax=Nostoc sp. TaxID=1180 RepID=UPI002FFA1A4A
MKRLPSRRQITDYGGSLLSDLGKPINQMGQPQKPIAAEQQIYPTASETNGDE